MVAIPINSHDFEKVNTITIVKRGKVYDILKCSSCGLTGKRYGLEDVVYADSDRVRCKAKFELSRQKFQEEQERQKVNQSGKVKISDIESPNLEWQFGFSKGCIYDIVDPPEEYKGKYPDSVWVYSRQRGEPVRLLPGEFTFVEEGLSNEHSI